MEAKLAQDRMREIIINECLMLNIDMEHIEFGCNHASYMLSYSRNFAESVDAGVAVARGMHMCSSKQLEPFSYQNE